MAIRIVEQKPDPSVIRNCICKRCGVKLEYLPLDVLHKTYSDYGGGSDSMSFITCLQCGNTIEVK